MKPELECGVCLLGWVYGRAIAQNGNLDIPPLFRKLLEFIPEEITDATNLAFLCNGAVDLIYEFVPAASDFWNEFKKGANANAMQLHDAAGAYVANGGTAGERLERACFLAATANVAPIGCPSGAFTFPEAVGVIEERLAPPVLVGNPYEAARKAKNVLYVTDNAGEVGFDSFLIGMMKEMGAGVTLVVKDPAFFEDVCVEDATFFGLEDVVDEVVTTDKIFVPGRGDTRVERAFRASDLLVVKGTGSYESLMGETRGKKAIYLLKIKCRPLARQTGVGLGGFLVKVA
jgi:hypothetical protein